MITDMGHQLQTERMSMVMLLLLTTEVQQFLKFLMLLTLVMVHLGFVGKLVVNRVDRSGGFYGNPDSSQQVHSWSLLKRLRSFSSLPWLCGGDFNNFVDDSEKLGGLLKPQYLINNFREAVEFCGFQDLGYSGSIFTWSNKRHDSALIQESVRLDRSSRRRFFYEACWADQPSYIDCINRCWGSMSGNSTIDLVSAKLTYCSRELHLLNTVNRGNLKKQIKLNKNKLRVLSDEVPIGD
ncbi:hypothetical protein ACOSP7_022084 [Xanthoceras sorbifolium]